MKTQIIALDPQDDHLSVRDKMSWSQTGRVLLTWSSQQRVLSRLDLVLIQRDSAARAVQLALVTRNPEIRAEAAELGIPVFDSTRAAQAGRWRKPRRRRIVRPRTSAKPDLAALRQAARPVQPAWRSQPAVRIAAFGLSLLALLAMIVYLLPSARLALSPQTQSQALTLAVAASPEASQVSLAGLLPTYPVSVVVEARGSLPATGKLLTPFKPAIGGIQFTNLTEQDVDVPAGTVVCNLDSQPVRFATNQAGRVPAGVGKTVVLPATALTPGAAGNLPAGSLVAIEGLLGLQLSATNLTATHSGSDSPVSGPSQADRQELLDRLTAELSQAARQELQAILPPGDQALPSTLVYQRTLEEAYTPEPGQPAETLELTLRLEFSGQAVSGADLQAYATPFLDAALQPGFVPLPGTLEIRAASTPQSTPQGQIAWTIIARRTLSADLRPAEAVPLILGKSTSQARDLLNQALPLGADPLIEVKPGWWQRLPLSAFRIQVVLQGAP